ncbi:Metallophosphoesterase [Scheffersomyces stipitis CBS 6054]|uniref:Metallophosphoesterase n=1 Tax=Scheffersomyces stipitis (strain ATCC 58785 / CBS 6054 / NBRC 10063 / NRRL Y-11545) TaxID=322104 RepID=A3LT67_PICST|nr:Metallophosphoesterase [Scheffersomyces stipitis CBS 6054]ABN66018.2 Metallophosphoesterase [Scheffersomyces stipitis CBS 6054]
MTDSPKKVKIAVEGCCHGELNAIYRSLDDSVDLLIICGDFQAIRNQTDLDTMNVPKKYLRMADFHEYYSGTKTAPILTIFIGGNHECSSYLTELKFGGWVAPNIYYLGEYGSVWYRGIQIAGWSGIYNHWSFLDNFLDDESLPFTPRSIRSVYHTKPKNFLKMSLMNHDLDVVLSHDWPVGIEKYGDAQWLLRKKQYFKNDIRDGKLGSPLNKFLLGYLRPRYWFSGHLHIRFDARVSYRNQEITSPYSKEEVVKSDEIEINMDDEEEDEEPTKNSDEIGGLDMDDEIEVEESKITFEDKLCIDKRESAVDSKGFSLIPSRKRFPGDNDETYFLALDKCLPHRRFFEVIEVEVKSQNLQHPSVKYDGLYMSRRSVAINRVVEDFVHKHKQQFKEISWAQISDSPSRLTIINELREVVSAELNSLSRRDDSDFEIRHDSFKIVAPIESKNTEAIPLKYWENNQTVDYCAKFGIHYRS